ncbi:fungal-specific transcription factor domain-containing protein [Aspergillus pseudoustus]|uniref:Fungal-specific transcription factor domain-containing protein n=1 Tax=Aspergillus pseudoustus TaxID=1810923 RepID=A0ABR4IEB8_9EURO
MPRTPTPADVAEKSCHNCRRRRLKCDRGLPSCAKCAWTGQECLGYGKLFLWNRGVASRGKMMGKDFPRPKHELRMRSREPAYGAVQPRPEASLVDPIFGDMDYALRGYLFHFANNVSADMVISSAQGGNPFCSLIPLAQEHPVLLHAIVANAALHTSCLHQRSSGTLDLLSDYSADCLSRSQSDPINLATNSKIDALTSKHTALALLRSSLENIQRTNTGGNSNDSASENDIGVDVELDLIITVIHLLITFDLIDMGESEWRAHVQGAIRLISYLQTLEHKKRRDRRSTRQSPLASIRDAITSDCLTYYILGSTLMTTHTLDDPFHLSTTTGNDINASLIRAEANSYLSLPTPLLQILFKACELSNLVSVASTTDASDSDYTSTYTSVTTTAQSLLQQVQSFDVIPWAENLESCSPERQTSRIHTALAHRAAVQIYIIRSVDGLPSPACVSLSDSRASDAQILNQGTENLVSTIISHLSQISSSDPMFKATCWPTFIAGAETDDPVYREWALQRLREFWWLIPWGYIRTAVEVMRTSWGIRDSFAERGGGFAARGWVQGLKALERGWLIP